MIALTLLFITAISTSFSSTTQTKDTDLMANAYPDVHDWNNTIPDDYAGYFFGHLRKLVGSNCVLIERGTISPYYQCIGCDVRRAMGCISDLRANKSQNVDAQCTMGRLNEVYGGAACCPRFAIDSATGLATNSLIFMGSAYPESLRCIASVGCADSTVYSQLKQECVAVCPQAKATDVNVCFATFNASPRAAVNFYHLVLIVSSLLIILLYDTTR